MKIVAHDEDSTTNLFFSEVHRHDKLADFLRLIEWRSADSPPLNGTSAELHQQVNFSEFGRPDAIILVTDSSGKKQAVIVEVKLGSYLESCWATDGGKFSGSNSALNNQLALKYRAMVSLPSIAEDRVITELPHPAESPYSGDQVRRCKKRETIDFCSDLVTAPFYLVTLTADGASPTSPARLAPGDPCYPLFFNERTDVQEEFTHLGSVCWHQTARLFEGLDSHFTDTFALHFEARQITEEESQPLEQSHLFVSGRQIVEFDGKLCHLSCRGYSFALRQFREGHFVEIYRGSGDREKYLGLKDQLRIIETAPRIPLEDTESWGDYFRSLTVGASA